MNKEEMRYIRRSLGLGEYFVLLSLSVTNEMKRSDCFAVADLRCSNSWHLVWLGFLTSRFSGFVTRLSSLLECAAYTHFASL